MSKVILKSYKPTSPSVRWKRRIHHLTKGGCSIRDICISKKWAAGRTNLGKISDRGKKSKLFRKKILIFKPSFTSTLQFFTKKRVLSVFNNKSYWVFETLMGGFGVVPASSTMTVGRVFNTIAKNNKLDITSCIGVPISIVLIPFFSKISNICLQPYEHYSYATSSGVYCIKLRATKKEKNIKIQLPSGYYRFVPVTAKSIFGASGQFWVNKQVIGKAGINSNLGRSPKVRGIAMNSVDHPHGGKANSVQPEKSPWGWVTKASH